MEHYDVIVVGTGEGGSGVATRCAKAGRRVAIIDDDPYGGTCALRGCDPKRVLAGASELVDWHRRMLGHGVTGEICHICFELPELLHRWTTLAAVP